MARRTVARLVYNRLPEIVAKLPRAATEIVKETVEEIDGTVRQGMAQPKSGRVYVRGARLHTASAPGEMPAIDSRALLNSLQKRVISGKARGYYFTDNPYAAYLEYGTSKMAARPFMTPAAERARRSFMRKLRNLEDRLR